MDYCSFPFQMQPISDFWEKRRIAESKCDAPFGPVYFFDKPVSITCCAAQSNFSGKVMPIFQLSTHDASSPLAELIEALPASLAQEANLESWLENSPWAITQEPLLIIGRQTLAHAEGDLRFLDLLAVDKDG